MCPRVSLEVHQRVAHKVRPQGVVKKCACTGAEVTSKVCTYGPIDEVDGGTVLCYASLFVVKKVPMCLMGGGEL